MQIHFTFLNTMSDQKITYLPGERIIKKGEIADTAYMILSGAVRVYMKNKDKIVELATLKNGEIFGETSIFKSGEYGANVDALEETELLVITPQSLENMMNKCDPVLSALVQMLITRLKETNEKLLESETREFIDIALV